MDKLGQFLAKIASGIKYQLEPVGGTHYNPMTGQEDREGVDAWPRFLNNAAVSYDKAEHRFFNPPDKWEQASPNYDALQREIAKREMLNNIATGRGR